MLDGIYNCARTSYWAEPEWNNPKQVSVVITCHANYGTYLPEAIRSVKEQTYPNIELIVADDSSFNVKKEDVAGLPYYWLAFHSANKTRNFAFKKTHGAYVLFLDADDELLPSTISKFVYVMERDEAAVVGGQIQRIEKSTRKKLETSPKFPTFDKESLFISNYIQTSALIRRKDFIGFDEALTQFQDWDIWMRMSNLGKKIVHLPEVTLIYGVHGNNSQGGNMTLERYKEYYREVLTKNMTITITTLFSGKDWAFDKYFKRLSELTFPKNRTRLLFFDDSNSEKFSKMLRNKLKKIRSKYLGVDILSGGVKPAGYEAYAVPNHVATIYDRIRWLMIKSSHNFIWEDDELPPKDVITRLSKHFYDDVGIVSGYSKARQYKLPLVWKKDSSGIVQAFHGSKPSEEVYAVSFGCALIPSYLIKINRFRVEDIDGVTRGHDLVFCDSLKKIGFKVIVDWNTRCVHMDKRGIISTKMKLHLGCGYDYKADYINVDTDINVPADDYMDLTKPLPYPSDTMDLIETHHFIEHIPTHLGTKGYIKDFVPILKDWHRVLRGDGKIIIECPDFDALITLYHRKPGKRDELLKHIYGYGGENQYHYMGWSFNRLKTVLSAAGFKRIKKCKARDYHAKQSPCLRVEAIKE